MTESPSSADFRSVRVCVFDAYGTLLDVNAAARTLAEELGPRWEALAEAWRAKQLQYTWLRSLMGRYADFRVVTRDALGYALDSVGLAGNTDLAERLMTLYERLDPYPEVAETLLALRDSGRRTAILSNGEPGMLRSAVEAAGIDGMLDDVLSVDALRVYKPHPDVYALATGRFGVQPQEVAFFSSNGWDAAGAAAFGFRVVWVNRAGLAAERLPAGPEVTVSDLRAALPLFGLPLVGQ